MTTTRPTTAPADDAVLRFPSGFSWGTATAAYQIEGAADADGRRPSIWDAFSRVPGAVLDGDNGDIACDHYHRMPDDVALMSSLGLDAYRFSTSWARVCPDGGAPNPRGLGFYSRLVDELLTAGIRPWLTLYHWDLPQALEEQGGWTNRDTAHRFVEYAATVHEALGDRVDVWTTFNEPWCSAFLGYTGGQHAPGRQDGVAGLVAAHHLLLAHGLAVDELRRRDAAAQLGITLNLTVFDPHRPDDPADLDAVRRCDAQRNRLWLDALFRGHYPDDLVADTEHLPWEGGRWTDVVRVGDLEAVSRPVDFLGVNYYLGESVSGRALTEPVDDGGVRHPSRPTRLPIVAAEHVTHPSRGLPRTGLGWEIQPEALTRLLLRLRDEYDAPPIHITENGAAFTDPPPVDGVVSDPERTAYLDAHLRAVHAAVAAGVDVRGYFAWSLLDNFEWAYGYSQRFGLVHVDYETQQRTVKSSGHWYARVAATGALPPPPPEGH